MAFLAPLIPYLGTAAAAYGGHKLARMGEHSSKHSSKHAPEGMSRIDMFDSRQKKLYKDIIKRINPKALDLLNSPIFKQSQKYVSDFLKTSPDEQYKSFEKPIMSQFNQEIAPGIAERFAGMGAMNSSGFQQAMGAAGSNLSERLGMLREGLKSNYRQQQLGAAGMGANMAQMPVNNAMQMTNMALGSSPFGYSNQQQGFGSGMLGGVGSSFGGAAASWGIPKILDWMFNSGGGGGGFTASEGIIGGG
jgi:hypothetical protein